MSIYDLNSSAHLQHDLEDVFNKIEKIYKVDFQKHETTFYPKTMVDNNVHWTSPECQNAFNKLVPEIKSLTKDMYAILESVFKSSTGKFHKPAIEQNYPRLKELRLLNNKFKHFFDQEAEITVTSIVLMESHGHFVDIFVNYKYPDKFEAVRFCDLIETFFGILENVKVITIKRA